MDKKRIKLIFGIMLLSVLMIAGCGGSSSQSVLQQESPESAVFRISDSWRTSKDSPKVEVDSNGEFVKQYRAGETSQYKDIEIKDFSGGSFFLKVKEVVKEDTDASVLCHFVYNNDTYDKSGYLNILFKLIFDEGKWWLDDVDITDNNGQSSDDPTPTPTPTPDPEPEPTPATKLGVSGYVLDSLNNGIVNATVQAFKVNGDESNPDDVLFVASTTTNSDGYYEIDLENFGEGIYLLTITGQGVESKTIRVPVSKNVTKNCRL